MIEHKEKITCEICEKSFRSIRGLHIHDHTYHADKVKKRRRNLSAEKNFKCKYCRMKYSTQKGLDVHIAEHGK